jgi:hypothetical protein
MAPSSLLPKIESHRFIVAVLAGVLLVSCASSGGSPTRPEWVKHQRSTYPARVSAVVFQDGTAIDSSHGMTWGAWSVNWNPGTVAEIAQDDGDTWMITVRWLKCSNSVKGATNCQMLLSETKGHGRWCLVRNDQGVMVFFSIECPVKLNFE